MSHKLTLRHILAAATTAVAAMSLAACGSSGSGSTTTSADQPSAAASSSASQGAGGFAGRMPGTSGTIAAKQGTTLQVQNQTDGQVAVSYTGKTAITAQVAAALKDVKVGSCVTVMPATSSTGGTDSASQTSVAAGTVRISTAVNGQCTGGFGGGRGGFPGGAPSGMASSFPSDRPTAVPTTMPSNGARGGFLGASGKVTAVTGNGFTVASSVPSASGSSSSSSTKVTVTVSGSTTYTTTKSSDASALKVGKCVVATGQSDSTGAVAASRLVVSDPVDGSCTSGFGFGRGQGGAQAGSQGTSQQGGAA
jgi:hypothetical protein